VSRAWCIWCPFGGSWKMNPLPDNSRVSEDELRGQHLSFHHHVDFFSERLLDFGSFPSLNSWWSGAELQLSVQIFSNWGCSKAGYVTHEFLDRQAARRWSDRKADYFVINFSLETRSWLPLGITSVPEFLVMPSRTPTSWSPRRIPFWGTSITCASCHVVGSNLRAFPLEHTPWYMSDLWCEIWWVLERGEGRERKREQCDKPEEFEFR
jgi:hypothetical protein